MSDRSAGADLAEATTLVDQDALVEAAVRVDALLEADPADAGAWFLQARLSEAAGRPSDALVACGHALDLWPDILPVCRLLVRLGNQAPDAAPSAGLAEAERMLLAADPVDALLHNQIATRLCRAGDPLRALPHLRIAAPVLGHRDSALWNYTSALSLTGGHHELLAAEPLLRILAREVEPPFAPYVHLANAKLSLQHGRTPMLAHLEALRGSARWLDAAGLAAVLERSIARRRPFSMILPSLPEARLATYAWRPSGRHPILSLDAGERSAVANSVWQGWYGAPIESAGAPAAGRFGSLLLSALQQADIVGLPEPAMLEAETQAFGFLAEMQGLVLARPDRHFVPLDVMAALHETRPFLAPLLQDQPFLGHVGCHPELAGRMARFCGIGRTATWLLPAPSRGDGEAVLERLDEVLQSLVVPFQGAVFLVGGGLPGVICSAQIRRRGGIALPIDTVVERWMAGAPVLRPAI